MKIFIEVERWYEKTSKINYFNSRHVNNRDIKADEIDLDLILT